jgi:uncharacterized protein (UPF0371 family)
MHNTGFDNERYLDEQSEFIIKRADFGITYDSDMLRLIDDLRERGLSVAGVVITCFQRNPPAERDMLCLNEVTSIRF